VEAIMRNTDQGLPLPLGARGERALDVDLRRGRTGWRTKAPGETVAPLPAGLQPRKHSTATLHWAWAWSWTTTEGLAKTSTTLQRTSAPWGRNGSGARGPRHASGSRAPPGLCAAGRGHLFKPLCDYPIQQPITPGTWPCCAAGRLRPLCTLTEGGGRVRQPARSAGPALVASACRLAHFARMVPPHAQRSAGDAAAAAAAAAARTESTLTGRSLLAGSPSAATLSADRPFSAAGLRAPQHGLSPCGRRKTSLPR